MPNWKIAVLWFFSIDYLSNWLGNWVWGHLWWSTWQMLGISGDLRIQFLWSEVLQMSILKTYCKREITEYLSVFPLSWGISPHSEFILSCSEKCFFLDYSLGIAVWGTCLHPVTLSETECLTVFSIHVV